MSTAVVTTSPSLPELEAVIERGLGTFVEVGLALSEILERALYREDYRTFDDYCRERWGFSRYRAHRIMAASDVTQMLPIGNMLPRNEAQARELVRLPTPEARAEVWNLAVETHGDRVTAADVRRTAEAVAIIDADTGEVVGALREATPEDEARLAGLPPLREMSDEERAYDRLVALSLITRMDPVATAHAAARYRSGSCEAMLARGPTVVTWYEQFFAALQADLSPALRRVK